MKRVFDEIQEQLSKKSKQLNMNSGHIIYESHDDPGELLEGYEHVGAGESIGIPDEYMKRAEAEDSREFLNWLKSQ